MAFRPDVAVLGGVASGTAFITLAVATGAFLIYWATIGRVMAVLRRGLLWVGLAAGAVTLIAQAVAVSSSQAMLLPCWLLRVFCPQQRSLVDRVRR